MSFTLFVSLKLFNLSTVDIQVWQNSQLFHGMVTQPLLVSRVCVQQIRLEHTTRWLTGNSQKWKDPCVENTMQKWKRVGGGMDRQPVPVPYEQIQCYPAECLQWQNESIIHSATIVRTSSISLSRLSFTKKYTHFKHLSLLKVIWLVHQ